MDVNYAYWQQKQAGGGAGGELGLTTFPPDLLNKSGHPKASKAAKEGGQGRAQKTQKTGGQKTGGGQRDKVKKEKGSQDATAKSSSGSAAAKNGSAAAGLTASTASKKRKNAGGDEANPPKKASAANKAQKLAKSMLSGGDKCGVDMTALLPPQAAGGAGMATVSSAGTVVPNEASWYV
jgi:hypothetical protein